MKELEKLVKFILVPCKETELKPEHWLLLSPKNELHIPAAGGQYRRMIQGGYVPVKPYFVSGDSITGKDISRGSSILDKERDAYYKVAATPEQIHGCQIIMFSNGVKENFDVIAMNLILRMNGGGCKIQAEYNGVITENADEIIAEIKSGKLKPKLENGKVIITI